MKRILILNSNPTITDRIRAAITAYDPRLNVAVRDSIDEALEYLHYNLPALTILNFAESKLDGYAALEALNADLWLYNGSLLAIHAEPNEDRFLQTLTNSNLITVLYHKAIESRLASVVRIVLDNDKLIFQRELPETFENALKGVFRINNDPFDANVYANLVSLYLYNANLVGIETKNYVKNSLVELMMNAIEHGNCGIGFEGKSLAQQEGVLIMKLIEDRLADPVIAARKVTLSFHVSRASSTFAIADEGVGFDWRGARHELSAEQNATLAHGRGIFMTSQVVGNLRYNEVGNEVTFDVLHQKDKTNLRPRIFQGKPESLYREGDVVFAKGELSDFLGYIVSGTYHVLDERGKPYAQLNPNDIFVGEMAFLLDNSRTATVQAQTPGTIVKLSKNEFIECIQKFPYYGLFLARLLAQRMYAINQTYFGSNRSNKTVFLEDAHTLFTMRKFRAAANKLKLADSYYPGDRGILRDLAKYLAHDRRWDEGIEAATNFGALAGDDSDVLVVRAHCLHKLGRNTEAHDDLRRALEQDPTNPNVYFTLARVHVYWKDFVSARRHLARVLELMPHCVPATKLLAEIAHLD